LTDATMLNIARELGFSETAFLQATGQRNQYNIRYFSPVMEIPLCGHATLASARVLIDLYNHEQVTFATINGENLTAHADGKEIVMAFPVYATEPAQAPAALLSALGLQQINNAAYNKESNILLLEIDSWQLLARLTPDFTALRRAHDAINGVLVTAAADDGFDFHSRYFWPWSGTNEDPVTGGTHTFLAKYWSNRLHKTAMRSFQSSARSGFMTVELKQHRLLITSEAQIVISGRLLLST